MLIYFVTFIKTTKLTKAMKRYILYSLLFFSPFLFAQTVVAQAGNNVIADLSTKLIKAEFNINEAIAHPAGKYSNKYLFDSGSSWTRELGYIDGFVTSKHIVGFVFPLGDQGDTGFIGIQNPFKSTVSYYKDTPPFPNNFYKEDLVAVNPNGFWKVFGKTFTNLTVTYNFNKKMKTFSKGDLNNVKIIGYKDNHWQVLKSKVDPYQLEVTNSNYTFSNYKSNMVTGSISTTEPVDLTKYQYIAIGLVNKGVSAYVAPVNVASATDKTKGITNQNNSEKPNAKVGLGYNEVPVVESKASRADSIYVSSLNLTIKKVSPYYVSKDEMLKGYVNALTIYFPFDESGLTAQAITDIDDLLKHLPKKASIRLIGNTDELGSEEYNQKLGMSRALKTKEYFRSKGYVNTVAESKGEKQLSVSCEDCTEEDRKLNRRVYIFVK